MKAGWWSLCGLAVAALVCSATPAMAAEGDLDAYRVKATGENLRALANAGFDVTEGRNRERGTVDVIGTASQLSGLKVGARKLVDDRGRTSADRSRRDPRQPGGHAGRRCPDRRRVGHQLHRLAQVRRVRRARQRGPSGERARAVPRALRPRARGAPGSSSRSARSARPTSAATSSRSRSPDADDADIDNRPGRPLQRHAARPRVAGRRDLQAHAQLLPRQLRQDDAPGGSRALVNTRELWFVCVNNPDGYEYTFTDGNRLWRKNMRDNDANGVDGEPGDGVDPNRNFPANWGRDDEGSSPRRRRRRPTAARARPPSPRRRRWRTCSPRSTPSFQKNDHTAAELLLYPQGFQQYTPTADDEIFTGARRRPVQARRSRASCPSLGASSTSPTATSPTGRTDARRRSCLHPRGHRGRGPRRLRLRVPGLRGGRSRQEFRRHLPFALDLAKSADDPASPSRTSATRSRTSTSTRSRTPTAIRSRSR